MELFSVKNEFTGTPIKSKKEPAYKISFDESFSYLLKKTGPYVDFEPYIINKAMCNDEKLMPYCLVFDYFMYKVDREVLQRFMANLLPKYDKKYFGFTKVAKLNLEEDEEARFLSEREVQIYRRFLV